MLGCSCGVIYGLAKWGYLIEEQTGKPSIVLTIVTACIVFIFNRTLLGMIMKKATHKHYLDTKTDQDIELMQKKVLHEAINLGLFSIFVPFLAKLPNLKEGVIAVSLPINMLITILIQAFILPTQQFLALALQIRQRIFRKLAKR